MRGYTEEVFADVAETWQLGGVEREAPLPRATVEVVDEVLARASRDLTVRFEEVGRLQLAEVRDALGVHDGAPLCLEKLVDRMLWEMEQRVVFVQHLGGDRMWHVAASCGVDTPVRCWRTRCGWKFVDGGRYKVARAAPGEEDIKCRRCF